MFIEKFNVIGTREIKSQKGEFKIAYCVSQKEITQNGNGKIVTQLFTDTKTKVGDTLNLVYVRELNKYAPVTE